jgi:HPt (histidine-containing phosphotransfer) domain-containing protein
MLIDKLVLQNLANDLGSEVLDSLISVYVEDSLNTVEKLQQALKSDDYDLIALEVHTLKSVSATYGAHQALLLSKKIDAYCKQKEPLSTFKQELEQLISVLNDTVEEVKNFHI